MRNKIRIRENFLLVAKWIFFYAFFNNFNSKTASQLKKEIRNKDMDDELFIASCFKSE